ncbi:hypothetical protein V8E53_002921 [Lactarius tabidus]
MPSPPPSESSHRDFAAESHTGNPSHPFVHISMCNHTSAHSFFVNLSTDPLLGPLLEIGVDVTSNTQTHEIRVKIPADSQHALPTAIISAFRKLDQLVVHADSYEFRIKFSPHKVDVAAASALIDSDGVLLIRVHRLRGWLYQVQASSSCLECFNASNDLAYGVMQLQALSLKRIHTDNSSLALFPQSPSPLEGVGLSTALPPFLPLPDSFPAPPMPDSLPTSQIGRHVEPCEVLKAYNTKLELTIAGNGTYLAPWLTKLSLRSYPAIATLNGVS